MISTCQSMSEKHGRVKGKGCDGRLKIIRAKMQKKLKFVTHQQLLVSHATYSFLSKFLNRFVLDVINHTKTLLCGLGPLEFLFFLFTMY